VFLHAIQLNEQAKLTYGWNFMDDQYKESYSPMGRWNRHERVQGGMAEWAWNHHDEVQIIAGARAEWHNLFGFLFTPRIHTRFTLAEGLHLKWMTGLGRRTANVIMDQPGFLASSRVMSIQRVANQPQYPLGLPMEEAWNKGVVLSYDTKWFYRKAGITIDAFQTNFKQQVVMDWDQSGVLKVYALQGKSISTTAQMEAFCSPVKRLEVRLAYRWVENLVDYQDGQRSLPFVSKNRFFTNVSYSTKMFEEDKRWLFDLTAKWNDGQRLPNLENSVWEGQLPSVSPAFWIVNGQVSLAREEHWDVYLGIENIFNFRQERMVLYSNAGEGHLNLDANFAYAPAFGRMGYVGLRWRLGQ
jgi:outer membrane receptor for ferrienterochelin and colicin